MDQLDEVTIATLRAAKIGEDILPSLSREEIKDLFPGPENFHRRRAIWLVVNKDEKVETAVELPQPSATGGSGPSQEEPNISKFVVMSSPEFIVYSDSELEQVRRSYFEQKRMGTESVVVLSKELFCRLIRNTMCNMISIARATEDARYPTKPEVNAMAKRLVEYYPMVKDWEHVAKKMIKRLSNVKSPKKANPPAKKQRRECGEISTSDYDGDSSASTVILHRSPSQSQYPSARPG
ncbi:uncharacterized protein LOC130370251 isoform X2 [Gadus chalcogrammus]|uniref:uncharacterized protein LOC130370251 isoform X2 n=1 Tax=Gadus chalcogrammus TaxID=1042646 RepID=UPI0024C4BA62|nr:uncharacterized protein LOC130370251 isoform X2 [Gadus chalcogrammus]